ncbi:integrase [Paeniroseomonas aquatica]|uniref:integrase n=1 Tax=Paeniroseomonas aquatica TaxID=373043 RepID=UPI00362187F4
MAGSRGHRQDRPGQGTQHHHHPPRHHRAATFGAYPPRLCRRLAGFSGWCAAAGQPALPATPEAVAGHLASLAGRLGPSGLRRRLAAITDRHRRAGQAWDPAQPLIRATLRDLVARQATPVRPAAALGEAALRPLLASCGDDLAGRRDRALFLLVQATALRRAALVALDREQLRFTAAGMVVETAQGALKLARAPDSDRCPVRALEAWLRQARIDYGAVFRRVTAAGTLEDRLSPQGVWRILRRRAALARLRLPAGRRLSPEGLRAGARLPPASSTSPPRPR